MSFSSHHSLITLLFDAIIVRVTDGVVKQITNNSAHCQLNGNVSTLRLENSLCQGITKLLGTRVECLLGCCVVYCRKTDRRFTGNYCLHHQDDPGLTSQKTVVFILAADS
jgi:hypothetical protein